MNNPQQSARVGLFFLLGLALTWVAFATLSGGSIFRDKGYVIIADFDSLKEIRKGDEVRLAGVKIGTVETTRRAGRKAEAVLRIDPTMTIQSDATATIVMSGLIGTNYIGVDLGTAGAAPLRDGDEIHTAVTPDINSVMSDIGDLGKKLDGALGTFSEAMNGDGKTPGLFQNLNLLVTDNRGKLATTLDNLQAITGKINSGQGTLGLLVNDTKIHDDALATIDELKTAADQAKTFIANAQTIVDQVKSGQGPLGTLVYDDKTAANLKTTVQNARDVSDKLANGQGTLGQLLNNDNVLRDAQAVLKKADTALDSMGDSGPITAVGVLAQALF
jgi:phospholipid/cholesterol/gamma-HCH transport system substrate-binding protein